jgi:hypothetical protein
LETDDGMMAMIEALRKVIKRMHDPLEVMLCAFVGTRPTR